MKKILVLIAAAFSFSAFASSPGGSDMCGLGWQVTSKKSFLGTSTRGTTNVFVPPTFGMTSGTIGCDQHSIADKRHQEAATFAIANFENLRIEMAEGRGENLAAFAQTMGCSDAAAFGQMTKAHYPQIMKGAFENPAVMFRNLLVLESCGV